MKTKILYLVLIGLIGVNYSFFAPSQTTKWKQSNCYENLYYRVKSTPEKNNGERMAWEIVFKNSYEDLITFNYAITEDKNDLLTNHRKTLQAGEMSKPIGFYTKIKDFYVLIDQLSFSLDGSNTIDCDY